jgi:hypothetical protein
MYLQPARVLRSRKSYGHHGEGSERCVIAVTVPVGWLS